MAEKFRELTQRQVALLALYGSVGTWEWDGALFDGVSPYEIEKRLKGGVGAGYNKSSVYRTSKELAAAGYLVAREFEREEDGSARRSPVGGKTTVYTLTQAGKSTVEAWLRTSCKVPRFDDEAGFRLEGGRYSLDAVLEGLVAMRPALKTLARRIDEAEENQQGFSDPTVELRYGLYRALTDARLKWLADAERVLRKTIKQREKAERDAKKKSSKENQAWAEERRR